MHILKNKILKLALIFQSFVLCVRNGVLQLGQVVHTRFAYALVIKTPWML